MRAWSPAVSLCRGHVVGTPGQGGLVEAQEKIVE
jgi:hypothetical protein